MKSQTADQITPISRPRPGFDPKPREQSRAGRSPDLLAAVDLGSNSFRLLVGRVVRSESGQQVMPIDALKESVRLASGLDESGMLDAASQQRALKALHRFGERLRSFAPDTVRVVGTNTLRVARNARSFLASANAALGFPVDVIAGKEEARLIYLGAAHALPADKQSRLVIDIGGGSTECIIGTDYRPALAESAVVGCVSLTEQFFPDGRVSNASFSDACFHARDILAPIARQFRETGWSYAVGTSGTAKALTQIAQSNFGAIALDREALHAIEQRLLKAGSTIEVSLEGLSADRRPVLPGGLAVMSAVFDELGIKQMRYCPSALRQGVLYDLLGRAAGADMREVSVEQMAVRYGTDPLHAARVADTAVRLFDQVARGTSEILQEQRSLLRWSALLCEVGMSVAHEDFHKHSAYLVKHSDMAGFTRSEQLLMSRVVLGQTGGLRKLREQIANESEWLLVLAIRLASILHRHRDDEPLPMPALFLKHRKARLEMPANWAHAHPLSDATLASEARRWNDLRVFDEFEYRII